MTIEGVNLVFRKNKSWLASIELGLRAVFWWAPTTLLASVLLPIAGLIGCLAFVIFTVIVWAFSRIVLLIYGFAGHLTELPMENSHANRR
jgi:hypothetical protein